eukprot:364965-Chlamydomonas_euryale.AAC.3
MTQPGSHLQALYKQRGVCVRTRPKLQLEEQRPQLRRHLVHPPSDAASRLAAAQTWRPPRRGTQQCDAERGDAEEALQRGVDVAGIAEVAQAGRCGRILGLRGRGSHGTSDGSRDEPSGPSLTACLLRATQCTTAAASYPPKILPRGRSWSASTTDDDLFIEGLHGQQLSEYMDLGGGIAHGALRIDPAGTDSACKGPWNASSRALTMQCSCWDACSGI